MDFETYNFRHALAILEERPEWDELIKVISGVARSDIIAAQQWLASQRKKPPAGAQQAVNLIFRERLPPSQWMHECRLFETSGKDLAKWAMDFVKRGSVDSGGSEVDFGLGVEISFNHAEAIAWTLVRLDLASEAGSQLRGEARIDVGVAIYASESFKRWGRMDGAVGTFEMAQKWLEVMRPVIPIPLVLVGLKPRDAKANSEWAPASIFRGTSKSS